MFFCPCQRYSQVHFSRRRVMHFCPPISWWPSGAPQSSAGTSSCPAPPPPEEQREEERRRKITTKKGSTCRQAGNWGGWERGWDEELNAFHWETVGLCALYTVYSHAYHGCISCMCRCDLMYRFTILFIFIWHMSDVYPCKKKYPVKSPEIHLN